MSTITTDRAVDFFYEHGGYSYDPATETAEEGRRRCAESLARAEAWAREVGITFGWYDDWSLGMSHREFYGGEAYDEGDPSSCEFCSAELDGEALASLGCIDDASSEYRRVIEAELAAEALHYVLDGIERQLTTALVLHA